MNEKQKMYFEAVYNHFHDENHHSMNLISLINLHFPEDGSPLGMTMNLLVKPALEVRAKISEPIMDILRSIKEGENEDN